MSNPIQRIAFNPVRPIRVFISSKCGDGGRFDSMRSQLADKINSSQVFQSYVFERDGASSEKSSERYLAELNDCDVVVFIIDNFVGVTEGVQKEIDRARRLDKRSLYYFVNELSDQPTQLQKQLSGADGPTYKEVQKTSDVPVQVMHDLEYDVLERYREWCNHDIISRYEQPSPEGNQISLTDNAFIPKPGITQLPGLQAVLNHFLFNDSIERDPIPGIDAEAAKISASLFIHMNFPAFDPAGIVAVAKNLLPEAYANVIAVRWQAIHLYLNSNERVGVNALDKALSIADTHSLAQWFIDDILIDLRNMCIAIDGIGARDNKYQERLASKSHEVTYPLVDREVTQVFEAIEKDRIKEVTQAYGTVTYGNNPRRFLTPVCRVFAIACCFGSFTHLSLSIGKMRSIVLYLCSKYRDARLHAAFLKLSIVDGANGDGQRTLQAFNNMKFDSDSNIAKDVFDFCAKYVCLNKHETAIYEGFSAVGCYLNDADFAMSSSAFIQSCEQHASHSNQWKPIPEAIFQAIAANIGRLSKPWVEAFCTRALDSNRYFWRQEALSFLSRTNLLNELVTSPDSNLLDSLDRLAAESQEHNERGTIVDLLIRLRTMTSCQLAPRIEQIVQKLPDELRKCYFGITCRKEDDNSELIDLVNDAVRNITYANEAQGKDGAYSFGKNHHLWAANLIANANKPSVKLARSAYAACLGTISSPSFDCGWKIHACEALCILLNTFGISELDPGNGASTVFLDKISLLQGTVMGAETMPLLNVWTDILAMLTRNSDAKSLLTSLGRCYQLDIYTQARAGDAVGYLLKNEDIELPDYLNGFIFSYASFLARSLHFQLNLRGLNALALFLRNEAFRDAAARLLFDSYDGQSPRGKCIIIDSLTAIREFDESLFIELRNKVLRDNTEPAIRHLNSLDTGHED